MAVGREAGRENQGENSVAIGGDAGRVNQSSNSIALGVNAGQTNQGQYAIAIGNGAGRTNQSSQSICLNASTTALAATNQGFYARPVRSLNSTSTNLLALTSSNEIVQNAALSSFDSSNTFLSNFALSVKANSTLGQQVSIGGFSNVNQQLILGYSTTFNYGQIEAIEQNVAFRNLILNQSSSSNVGIGLTGPAYQLHLSTDSAAKQTSNTWIISSDARIKENIVDADLDICYNVVKNLRLRRFKWKDEYFPYTVDKNSVGWIAQEVKEVFPKAISLVEKQQFLIKKPETTSESAEFAYIDNCLNVDCDQIYKTMYGTIKKLIEKVELLEQKVEILENNII